MGAKSTIALRAHSRPHAMTDKPVLHGANGSTLKATTVLAILHWLGVKPS